MVSTNNKNNILKLGIILLAVIAGSALMLSSSNSQSIYAQQQIQQAPSTTTTAPPTTTTPLKSTTTTLTNNSTTTNATAVGGVAANGGPIITNMTWYEDVNFNPTTLAASGPANYQNISKPLSPTNIEYQKSDANFAKLAQVTYDCLQDYNRILRNQIAFREENAAQLAENPGFGTGLTAEDINGQDLCTDTVSQGINIICDASDFASYDIAKCEEARTMTDTYLGVATAFYG